MSKFALPAAALAASTLLFSFSASADGHRDRSRYDRHHERYHDSDRRHDNRRDNDRRYYRDHHRYHDHNRYDRRYHRDNRRYYWNDGRYWRYSHVPSYYGGRYYSYRPRDSYGRLVITIPF